MKMIMKPMTIKLYSSAIIIIVILTIIIIITTTSINKPILQSKF